jgi:hypothetical protein
MKEPKRARKNSGGGRYEGEYGSKGLSLGGGGLSKFLPIETGGGGGGGGVTLGIVTTGVGGGNGGMTPAKFIAAAATADIAEQSNSLLSMSGAFSQDSNLSSG